MVAVRLRLFSAEKGDLVLLRLVRTLAGIRAQMDGVRGHAVHDGELAGRKW